MVKIACVRFCASGKVYYFDPLDFDLKAGDAVIVETIRGVEYGTLSCDICEIEKSKIPCALKPIIRIATEEDRIKHLENQAKKDKVLAICEEKINKHKLDMLLVDVQYTLDNSKLLIYFTSNGRVDFRELVKDLASIFKVRIELRQIGVRDETKMLGGLGCCGRELCCHSWLSDFEAVTIKMAKDQGLSLNPVKISGLCGRLMCCLQYENDNYIESRKGMPIAGEIINTKDGQALVSDVNILKMEVKTRLVLEENKYSTEFYYYKKGEFTRLKEDNPFEEEDLDEVVDESLAQILDEDSPEKKPKKPKNSYNKEKKDFPPKKFDKPFKKPFYKKKNND